MGCGQSMEKWLDACKTGNLAFVSQFSSQFVSGQDPRSNPNIKGFSGLLYAIKYVQPQIVEILLAQEFNLNLVNDQQEQLLPKQINIQIRSNANPLTYAVIMNNDEVIKKIIDKLSEQQIQKLAENDSETTLLQACVIRNNLTVLQFLQKVNILDKLIKLELEKKFSCFVLAVYFGRSDIIQFFLNCNVYPLIKTFNKYCDLLGEYDQKLLADELSFKKGCQVVEDYLQLNATSPNLTSDVNQPESKNAFQTGLPKPESIDEEDPETKTSSAIYCGQDIKKNIALLTENGENDENAIKEKKETAQFIPKTGEENNQEPEKEAEIAEIVEVNELQINELQNE
ncbi:Conserved_hypothetical protein [Hexamita inflata]|uniref:Ankyrin repeat protein n=1 Tax=Hexamita inflata TaxID=28002 RepID=A0AA86P1I8_9EUKA|nr:Conserved hypothetical protein [Hexamita inflata]CAI9942868.1 Conserved hypothetical protein [Hexamita inflata]